MKSAMKTAMRITVCLLMVAAFITARDAAAAEEEKGFSGEGEFGYVDTSGNTETESVIANLALRYRTERWSHGLEFESYFSSDSGETTAERYVGTLQSNYHLTARGYVFVRGQYVDDRFAGFDYRVKEVVGYGHRVIETDRVTVGLEAGPGGRHSRTTEGDKEDELILYAAGHFLWKISQSASFTEDIRTEVGEDGTQTESVTAVKAAINANLSLKLSYTVRDNTDPPPGKRSTDAILAATLVYDF